MPNDVDTHLVPFARAHKTMILAGLTYEEILAEQPLVNSALWVIPEWSDTYGLQIKTRRQGKAHLAPNEQEFKDDGTFPLQGFRPCQWLIGYPWSDKRGDRPVWLTAAVCYDATDLGLVADLRNKSDILAIPALNKDVKTFDQMALALHYHMFQLVVVANNGQYGGSNAYWPRSDAHVRQVFHTHGQPQTAIAFFEIDDIGRTWSVTTCWEPPPPTGSIPPQAEHGIAVRLAATSFATGAATIRGSQPNKAGLWWYENSTRLDSRELRCRNLDLYYPERGRDRHWGVSVFRQ